MPDEIRRKMSGCRRRARSPVKIFCGPKDMGYRFKRNNPMFTNLSAVQPTQSCRKLAAHQMKGGHHGYQLRKYLQPPRHVAVAADSGFEPGSQLGRRLLVASG